MEGVLNYALSTVLIGFLEQGFISIMAIRLLKSIDSLYVNRLKKILLVTAPAILLNLPQLLGLNQYIALGFGLLVMASIITLITKRSPLIVLLAVGGAFLLFLATEGIFGYSVMAAAGLTTQDFLSNAPLAFLASLPERIVQYLIVYFISVSDIKRLLNPRCRKVNLFSIIKSTKSYRIYACIALLILVLYMSMFVYLFAACGLLRTIHPIYAILVSTLIVCTPYFILLILIESLYKSYSVSSEYTEYLIQTIRSKTLQAHMSALKTGDGKIVDDIENILTTLDLTGE